MSFQYPKELKFDEIVTLYCQLISLYDEELVFTGEYGQYNDDLEYAIIEPM